MPVNKHGSSPGPILTIKVEVHINLEPTWLDYSRRRKFTTGWKFDDDSKKLHDEFTYLLRRDIIISQ